MPNTAKSEPDARPARAQPDAFPLAPRISAWCGWVLVGFVALTPLLGWLAPLGFAPWVAIAGLLSLPALRLRAGDWALALVACVGLAWMAASVSWSPYRPDDLESMTALKVCAASLLFAAAICGARIARADLSCMALAILAAGLTVHGLVLVAEGVSGAAIYQAVVAAVGEPIRADLAARNVARGAFVLAVLTPTGAVAAWRLGWGPWPGLAMVAGVLTTKVAFDSDAPALALPAAAVAALVVRTWPRSGPRAMGVAALSLVLAAPVAIWLLEAAGLYGSLQSAAPLSWSDRMGYWRFAADRIAERPLFGWGLDASRTMSPGIVLHPHNGPLQFWLELGALGAIAAAALWAMIFRRAARPAADAAAMAAAGSAAAYFGLGAVSFGIWQDWWLALGAAAAIFCTALARLTPAAAEPSSG